MAFLRKVAFSFILALVTAQPAAHDARCGPQAAVQVIRQVVAAAPTAAETAAAAFTCARAAASASASVLPWFDGRADIAVRMGSRHSSTPVVYRIATLLAGTVSGSGVRLPDFGDDKAPLLRAQILTLPGSPSADAVSQSMRDMPLRGLLSRLPEDGPDGPLYLLLAPTLLDSDDCRPPAADNAPEAARLGSDGSSRARCTLGGEHFIFPSAAAAGQALVRELALGAAAHLARPMVADAGYDAAAGAGAAAGQRLVPRSLLRAAGVASLEEAAALADAHAQARRQRRQRLLSHISDPSATGAADAHAAPYPEASELLQTHHAFAASDATVPAPRRAYISPATSRGSRALLGIRVKFNGQADSVATTAADATAILWNASSVLNRAAMGAGNGATFSWGLAQSLHMLPSSFVQCSGDTDGMATTAISLARAADPTLNISAYQHVVVFLPDCPYPWAGLADTPGDNSWMNGLTAGPSLDTSVLVLVHEIGHNVSADSSMHRKDRAVPPLCFACCCQHGDWHHFLEETRTLTLPASIVSSFACVACSWASSTPASATPSPANTQTTTVCYGR